MQLGRLPVVVRVAAGDDARPARAATACRQVGLIETDSIFRQSVDVRRSRCRVSVAAVIVPADVVGDEENDVRSFSSAYCNAVRGDRRGQQASECQSQSRHDFSSCG
jgi:hypothetical protein